MIKKTLYVLLALTFALSTAANLAAQCTNIQSGTLMNSYGDVLTTGFDDWGYNYQSQSFNGGYCDSYHNAAWCQEYSEVNLMMKWNSAWLSNLDCDGNMALDRHFGYDTYVDSGAWLTNHQSGKVEVNGKMRNWTYFVKIVAVKSTDELVSGSYYRDGTLLGPAIWDDFAIVEEVINDPSAGQHGLQFRSMIAPALGGGVLQ